MLSQFFVPTKGSRLLTLLIALLPVVTMVTLSLGAWTRLGDAGLGCPDWPGCYGFALLPSDAEDIALAESRYPDTPYEHDKALLEVVHRYVAASTGLLIFAILALLLAGVRLPQRAGRRPPILPLTILLAAVVCVQGLFGYLTVSLKLWPQVVTAHLLGGMLVLALGWMLCLRSVLRLPPAPIDLWPLFWLALVALLGQITLGAWVSSNYAALACTDFPLCQGRVWPPMDFAAGFDLAIPPGPNFLYGQLDNEARTAIHIAHRFGAVLATVALSAVGVAAWRQRLHGRAALLLLLLATQLLLGILNVVLVLPLPVALGHHAVAAFLLITLLSLLPANSPDQ